MVLTPAHFLPSSERMLKWAKEAGIFLYYTACWAALTWPLIAHISTHIVGAPNSDAPIFFWNVWEWQRQLGANSLFLTTDQLYPFSHSLLWHTSTIVQSIFVIGIQYVVKNPTLAFNIGYVLISAFSAYAAYRWIRLLTNNSLAAILGGQLAAFQPLWSIYAQFGTQNILTIWFIPTCLWIAESSLQKQKTLRFFWCGIVAGLAIINDSYIGAFTLASVSIYTLLRWWTLSPRSIATIIRSIWFGLLGFVLVTSWYIPLALHTNQLFPIEAPTLSDVALYHADPINLIRPTQFHPLWGQGNNWFTPLARENGNAFIGFASITIIFAYLFLRYRKKIDTTLNRLSLIIVSICALLLVFIALGPELNIAGWNTHIRLPQYYLLDHFPFLRQLRMLARWLIPAYLFFAASIAILVARLLHTAKKQWHIPLALAICACALLDVAFVPRPLLPIHDAQAPALEAIAKSNLDGAVLNIPFGISSGYFTLGDGNKYILIQQTIHNRPIVGGHMSRLSNTEKRFYEQQPVIKYFLNLTTGEPDKLDTDPGNIDNFFSAYHLRFIVIDTTHAQVASKFEELTAYIAEYLHMKLWYADNSTQVWAR